MKFFRNFLIFLILFVAGGIFSWKICLADENVKLFPPLLTSEGRQESREIKVPMAVEMVKYRFNSEDVEGYGVYPKNSPKNLPAVLFLHYKDERPKDQIERMKYLAQFGYYVLCVPWKNSEDVKEAYRNLLLLPRVDATSVGVLGIHQGGTEALLLACNERRSVKAVASVAGVPPYDMPGGNPAETLWAPVFLVHGEKDTQTPLSVSQYFYFNLQDKGRRAQIFLMKETGHYYNDVEWYQIMEETAKFFNRYAKEIVAPEDRLENRKQD